MASGKGNVMSQKFLDLVYTAAAWANVADNAASGPLTVLYCELHTASPASSGSQNTSEAAYGSYARVSVARSGSGFHRSSQTMSNVAAITFPACTSGSETETHCSVGTASSSTGQLWHWGALTSSLAVSTGITPNAAIDAFAVTES